MTYQIGKDLFTFKPIAPYDSKYGRYTHRLVMMKWLSRLNKYVEEATKVYVTDGYRNENSWDYSEKNPILPQREIIYYYLRHKFGPVAAIEYYDYGMWPTDRNSDYQNMLITQEVNGYGRGGSLNSSVTGQDFSAP